ncbi:MAG: HdeD family acid-resistance protein [Candidatus Coproplasma sp.]
MSDLIKDGLEEQTAPPDNAVCESAERELPEAEVTAKDTSAIQNTDASDSETNDEISRDITTFNDEFLENISVESNVEKVVKHTKLPQVVVKYIMGIVYIVLGSVCAAIPKHIESVLPYIVGSILGVFAILRFIFAMIEKEYEHTHSNKTASSIILLGVSIMIIIEHEWAHSFIPTVWGVWGLFEGAHAFNHALARIAKKRRFFFYLFKGIVEVVVAFLLLYEPQQFGELHIIVFGISLIFDGIIVIPPIHKFLTRR